MKQSNARVSSRSAADSVHGLRQQRKPCRQSCVRLVHFKTVYAVTFVVFDTLIILFSWSCWYGVAGWWSHYGWQYVWCRGSSTGWKGISRGCGCLMSGSRRSRSGLASRTNSVWTFCDVFLPSCSALTLMWWVAVHTVSLRWLVIIRDVAAFRWWLPIDVKGKSIYIALLL